MNSLSGGGSGSWLSGLHGSGSTQSGMGTPVGAPPPGYMGIAGGLQKQTGGLEPYNGTQYVPQTGGMEPNQGMRQSGGIDYRTDPRQTTGTGGAEPRNGNSNQQGGNVDPWGQSLALAGNPRQNNSGMGGMFGGGSSNQYGTPVGAPPGGYNGMFGGGQGMQPPAGGQSTGTQQYQFPEVPNLSNGAPNFMGIANQQSQYNLNNAQQQSNLNNPNFYGPGGSQVRTRNPDGSYSVTQSLSPELQQAYTSQNQLQARLMGQANNLVGSNLSYAGLQGSPEFNTNGVAGIPNADADNLAKTRDSLYAQQTQYLDPQFQQAQSDLDSKLANQGVMPGSEAYNREVNNLAQTKQKAYGDARNAAIQAGGAEQSRQFGLGLQQHSTGINDALAKYNTGMQGRQQGVSEANSLHNSGFNDLTSLRSGPQVALPQYQGQTGTSIPGVDYMNAANLGYNANLGISNANAAQNAGMTNGLFNLGGTFLNSGMGQQFLSGLFGGGGSNMGSGSQIIDPYSYGENYG